MEDDPTTRLLGGRYRLLRAAGSGGMSEVHVARDEVLGRDVAVKLVRADRVDGPQGVDRLEREARATAALAHPNVVVVHDVLRDGDDAAIVMELVAGETLGDRLRRAGSLPWQDAIALAGHVADGLGAAHAAGLVHRDVKPSNVLLGTDGRVRVADFGIAGAVDASTQTTTVRGSIPYIAPEQARGERTGPWTDVYALGCVLHAMLVGRPPFDDDTGAAILGQHLHRDPTPPGQQVAGIPPALDALVLRMLAKDPAGRPRDMAAVRGELDAIARDPTMASDATAVLAPADVPTTPVATAPPGRRLAPVLAVVGLLAIAGLAWWALPLGGTDGEPASAEPTSTAPTSAAPTPDPTTSSPSPSPSRTPTDDRPETVEEVATAYRATLVQGRDDGEASAKAVEELDKLVTEIVRKDREGKPKDVRDKARELDEKADEMVEKGEMTAALRDRLDPIGQDFLRVATGE